MRALLALAAATLVPAAGAQGATLTVDRPCVAEGETAQFTASGLAPGATLPFTFTRAGAAAPLRALTRTTDAQGGARIAYRFPRVATWFRDGETAFTLAVAFGEARTTLRFVRRTLTVDGRIAPDRPVRIRASGFASQRGRVLYAHWLRGGRRVHTARIGRLGGTCGSVSRRLRRGFPFRPVNPGTWHVAFNTSGSNPRAPGTVVERAARVKYRIP